MAVNRDASSGNRCPSFRGGRGVGSDRAQASLLYPIVLVISGLALSFVPRLPEVKLNPEIVFYFLPPLLYPIAPFSLWRDFRRNLRPILLLANGCHPPAFRSASVCKMSI